MSLNNKMSVPGWRLFFIATLVVFSFAVLVNRLWKLQVTDYQQLEQRGEEQSLARVRLAPSRGLICDRNGIPLAENRLTFNLDINLDDLERSYSQTHKHRPMIPLAPGKDGKPRAEIDMGEVVRECLQPILDSLNLDQPINDKEIQEHYRSQPDVPYHFMMDIDDKLVAQFKERNLGIAGITLAPAPVRSYTYGALAAHIMGYIGRPQNDKEHVDENGVAYETVGRHGLEAYWDDLLQGEAGSVLEWVSPKGYVMAQAGPIEPPQMGDTVYLTIDARIQYIVEMSLRKAGVGRAAAVVMNPQNGDVLALASIPSYDPNKFIPRINPADWKALNEDPTAPMFNRALHGLAPGSTYKIMVALAGLKSGKVTPDTEFDCPGVIRIGDHDFHNSDSKDAGYMALVHAIQVSSDTFFYQYGIRIGIDPIDEMGKLAGFGHRWNLLGDQDEDTGILPGPAWMAVQQKEYRIKHPERLYEERWTDAQTANTSIGQGYVLCTPLQMATFLCAVANGGTVYQPRLYARAQDVVSGDFDDDKRIVPSGTVFSQLGVKASDMEAVRNGMLAVVEDGTGINAKIPGFHMAGKTGTAQAKIKIDGEVKRDLKGWFYCFGPFENPRYVVCVMVEGVNWGGTSAAPIVKDIFQNILAWEQGADVNLAYLTPAVGNFNGVSTIETLNASSPIPSGNIPVAPVAVVANNQGGDNLSPMGESSANDSTPLSDTPPASNHPTSNHKTPTTDSFHAAGTKSRH